MSLKYFVKVGNVNNLSDARYCSAMGVNQLGFKLNDYDSNTSTIDNIKEIIGWINGVDTVAEFYNNDVQFINSIIEIELFDFIQLNHNININDINIDSKRIIISIKHIDKFNEFFVDNFIKKFSGISYLIIENIELFTSNQLYKFSNNFKILINPTLEFIKNEDLINKYSFLGFNLFGSDEIKAGFKDYNSISDTLDLIQN
jgi:phosphoribosylanthranilate isomerase